MGIPLFWLLASWLLASSVFLRYNVNPGTAVLLHVTIGRMEDAKTGEPLNGPGKGVVPDKPVATDSSGTDNQRLAADAFIRGGGKS